jgi:hypothetical protein
MTLISSSSSSTAVDDQANEAMPPSSTAADEANKKPHKQDYWRWYPMNMRRRRHFLRIMGVGGGDRNGI